MAVSLDALRSRIGSILSNTSADNRGYTDRQVLDFQNFIDPGPGPVKSEAFESCCSCSENFSVLVQDGPGFFNLSGLGPDRFWSVYLSAEGLQRFVTLLCPKIISLYKFQDIKENYFLNNQINRT